MTLHRKTLIIIEITIIVSVAILYVLAQAIVLGSFARLEEQTMREHVERAVTAFSDALSRLSSTGSDWAYWDDTVNFVEGRNEGYVQNNLSDDTLVNLKLNFMVFLDPAGRIVYGKGVDLQTGREMPLPQALLDYVAANPTLRTHLSPQSSLTGLVLFPQQVALVDSRPILTSSRQGPIRGTLIIGRYLDAAEVNHFARITRLVLAVRRPDDPAMPGVQSTPDDFRAVFARLIGETSTLVTPLSGETMAGYTLLRDINGQPALILRVEMPRHIYAQGRTVLSYFILLLLAFGLAFSLIVLWIFDRQILARLSRVIAAVCAAADGMDAAPLCSSASGLTPQGVWAGGDELAELTHEVNRILEFLRQQQAIVEKHSRELSRCQRYLKASAALARDATGQIDLSEFLAQAVERVGDQLAFQYVAVYTLDPTGEWAVLQSAFSAGGSELPAPGHRVLVGQEGWVSRAIVQGAPQLVTDGRAGSAAGSEAVANRCSLPLQVQGETIGALEVASQPGVMFDDDDMAALQALADQVALTIYNARLFRQVQDGLEMERRAYGELTRRAWAEMLSARPYTGYRYDGGKVLPLTEQSHPASGTPLAGGEAVLPIRVREHTIGTLHVRKDDGELERRELTLLETLVDRLGVALENARLYQDAQRRAARERLTREITDKMRRAASVEEIVQTAVDELFGTIGASRAFARLGVGETAARPEAGQDRSEAARERPEWRPSGDGHNGHDR